MPRITLIGTMTIRYCFCDLFILFLKLKCEKLQFYYQFAFVSPHINKNTNKITRRPRPQLNFDNLETNKPSINMQEGINLLNFLSCLELLVCAHAPIEHKDEIQNILIKSIQNQYITAVLDNNTFPSNYSIKVGRESIIVFSAAKLGLHAETTHNGLRLIDFDVAKHGTKQHQI